ncbi:MAG: RDD family protein, partial [Nocardioides sp.]
PYGAPAGPYGAAPAYGGQQGLVPAGGYASWIKRVGAYIIDGLAAALAGIPLWIGYAILLSHIKTTTNADGTTTSTMTGNSAAAVILIVLGLITYVAFWVWNTCLRQGRSGYSIGKGVLGIRLLDANTAEPIGGLMSFVRQLVHVLDSLACYLGWLWPLWDAKSQTFADKIMHTVVVNQPQGS